MIFVHPPDLMPDLNGYEYRSLLKNYDKSHPMPQTAFEDKIETILQFGQRNLAWLDHMNSLRAEKIRLSTPENRRTYPIESPSVYNETIILINYESLLKELPPVMGDVLLGKTPFTDDVPVDVNDYTHFAILADYVYQSAARWKMLKPYLLQLASEQVNDVRGYYFLSKLENRDDKLSNFATLADEEQKQVRAWLVGLCYNTVQNNNKCLSLLNQSLARHNNSATFFYNEYVDIAELTYNDFFSIPTYAKRNDIVWTQDNPSVATIPFEEVNSSLKNFLHNVELEWKWNDWQLVLNYVTDTNVPHITFEPGATPHVNDLGGNEIVMDANLSLDEWDNQWTIRHEFGHVLGFPDCYVEFYDTALGAIINYQVDVSNLMCSRKGQLNEGHYLEMKKNYFN